MSQSAFRAGNGRWFVAVLFFMLLAESLPAQESAFPDNYGVRQQLQDTILAPANEVLAARTAIYTQSFPELTVRFQVQRQNGDFYLLFTNRKAGRYQVFNQGSFVIKRSQADGSFAQVKVFLNGDEGSFARIFPSGDRVAMDVYLYGHPLYQGIMIPVEFESVLVDPFAKIIDMTRNSVDWNLIFPQRPLSEDQIVSGMVDTIRKRLPSLSDHDDGAMNAQGKFVYIATLRALSHGGFNCSGFDKWIIDGLYAPRAGKLIDLEELKQKHLDLRGSPSSAAFENLDPYFGLDWIRNLALAVDRLDNPEAGPEDADVRSLPFFRYADDAGYPLEDLGFILYELAVENPGSFYLGSVNHQLADDASVRQHSHVVALFPYFAPDGRFTVAVMERNLETGIQSLQRRYPNNFIYLEKVRASRNFSPPSID